MIHNRVDNFHRTYMHEALALAHRAFDQNEVPVGAIVIDPEGQIIGRGFNQVEGRKSQSAHAEITAIEQATAARGDWRLDGCTIYVTLEPCSMCYSLIRLCRFKMLVFGATSARFGYQLDNIATSSVYKKDMIVVSGICSASAQDLLKRFFQKQRIKKGEYCKRSQKD